MERYLGADVHARSTTVEVLGPSGRCVRRNVVETNGQALVTYLKQLAGNLHLCIEEGEWSQWLVEIVVFPGEWKPGSRNDAIDAHELADRIRTRRLPRTVYKDPRRFTDLREYSRAYTMVTRDVARTKCRIKSLFRGRGISVSGDSVYSEAGRAKKVTLLPTATRQAVELLGRELDHLLELKEEAEKVMVRESHRHKISRIIETAPGIGPVRAAQMLPIVITPHRFRTKRPFWAYCGFGIIVHSSADWMRDDGRWIRSRVNQTRGLNFNHNHTLKAIFKGAAITVLRHTKSHPLKDDYDRLLENGTKPNLAQLTIARKIAAIVLAMWKREERYQPEAYRLTTVA